MLYNTSKIINLTKSELLDLLDELEVYTYYMGFKPLIGQTYISPLRNDKSPSFNLFWAKNGRLLYKDFGTGESGDCIQFVKTLTGNSINQVKRDIQEVFISKKNHKSTLNLKNKKPLRRIPQTSSNIEIKKMPFTEEGVKYWNSFGINVWTLDKYEVSQVKKVWINGELKLNYYSGNPIFAYQIYDRLKIYQPLNEHNRFFTNCNVYYIQGWKQLNKERDTLIITKSLKDVMLLDILGYSAIAPNGEGYDIPSIIITEIKKHFKNVILLYDRDRTGMINTRKLFKKYNFDFKFIPKKFKSKDLTDFCKKYGKSKTKKLMSNLIT